MYPTSVPTHSEEIGTSRSTTGSTLTTGGGGGPAARDESPQPAAATVIAASRKPANREWPAGVMKAARPGPWARSRQDGFTAEPTRGNNSKEDEHHEHDDLRDQERRLGLLRSKRVQRGDLQERLDDADEHVEVEREGGAHDVGPAPRAIEAQTVASHDRHRQHGEREDADHVRRQEVIDGKAEPGGAGGHRGHEEERGPPAALSSIQQAGHHDEPRADPDQAQHDVHERERRERHTPNHGNLLSPWPASGPRPSTA